VTRETKSHAKLATCGQPFENVLARLHQRQDLPAASNRIPTDSVVLPARGTCTRHADEVGSDNTAETSDVFAMTGFLSRRAASPCRLFASSVGKLRRPIDMRKGLRGFRKPELLTPF
jgi:hypothetical protein